MEEIVNKSASLRLKIMAISTTNTSYLLLCGNILYVQKIYYILCIRPRPLKSRFIIDQIVYLYAGSKHKNNLRLLRTHNSKYYFNIHSYLKPVTLSLINVTILGKILLGKVSCSSKVEKNSTRF